MDLVHDVLHPYAPHAYATAHRINTGLPCRDRDLRALARNARDAFDLDGAVVYLWHLDLEQPLEQVLVPA